MDRADEKAAALHAFVGATVGWRVPPSPGRWRRDVDLALVDAVFTPRAAYGRPTSADEPPSNASACVEHWRGQRGDHGDDLRVLAGQLAQSQVMDGCTRVDDSRVPGPKASRVLRWEAVREIAERFTAAGATDGSAVRYAAQQNPGAVSAVFTTTKGLGEATCDWFLLLLGAPLGEADPLLRSFVAEALGDDVPRGTGDEEDVAPEEATYLLRAAAELHDVDEAALHHAVWTAQRAARRAALDG